MSLECGIVGLPNVGKSTLFNALTRGHAQASNYPFCTIEPNTGVVSLPDRRLDFLADRIQPERRVPATVRFVDIAGLVRNAHKGEGLGNQFLGHIRGVDAIVHLVRCFQEPDVVHTSADLDPAEDVAVVTTELLLADLDLVDRQLEKVTKMLKSAKKEFYQQKELLDRIRARLDAGEWLAGKDDVARMEQEEAWLKGYGLLARKPVLFVGNCAEDVVADPLGDPVCSRFAAEARTRSGRDPLFISAKVEAELAEMDEADAGAFREELGLPETGLARFIRASYDLLGLVTFFTVVGPECRAWSIRAGTHAVDAAGKIHTDMARGFVRAEVVSFEDLEREGSIQACKDKGILRLEGKEYPVRDGDVITFRFNV